MSNNVKVKPDQVANVIIKALAEYGDKTLEKLEVLTKNAARETARDIKAESPVGKKGSYARGWSHKPEKGSAYKLTEYTYNRTDPQLIHLLEKPHATRFGSYPSHVDYTGIIARIEEENVNKYYQEVIAKL